MKDIVRGIVFLAAFLGFRIVADGYPMLVEVEEDSERVSRYCQLNSIVFLASVSGPHLISCLVLDYCSAFV